MDHHESKANRNGREVSRSNTLFVESSLGYDKIEIEGSHELEQKAISNGNQPVEGSGAKVKGRTIIFVAILVFTRQAVGTSPDKGRGEEGTKELGHPVAQHLLPRHLTLQEHEETDARIHVASSDMSDSIDQSYDGTVKQATKQKDEKIRGRM